MRRIAVALLLLLCANAQGSAGGLKRVFGQGVTDSCGAWLEARRKSSTQAGFQSQWVAGYLSGTNAESNGPDFLVETDFDGLMAWIDNYCRSHPLEKVGIAAVNLLEYLRSRPH
jgi:hypothetical protein